jgi:hypothetical protein
MIAAAKGLPRREIGDGIPSAFVPGGDLTSVCTWRGQRLGRWPKIVLSHVEWPGRARLAGVVVAAQVKR